jgi:hypothetical protein
MVRKVIKKPEGDARARPYSSKRTVPKASLQTFVPSKKRILFGSLLVLLVALLAIYFSPLIVANGLRLWLAWKARQEKLMVTINKVDAPFLRPVVMHGIRVTSAPDSAFRIDLEASRAILELNLRAALLRMRGRAIQSLAVEGLRAEVHHNQAGTSISEGGWNTFQQLFPTNFNLERLDLRVEDGATVILLRSASLSASEVEPGHFRAGEIMIASPWLRQTFSDLRGATNWQGDRLTIAGLTLTHGLDVESIVVDLSNLGRQYLGLEFDLDAFGGKIRANISNEWRSHQSTWNVAGSAADVSLAQTSEALGLADRANGLLHACKFTFRGDPGEPTRGTASLWAELTGLKWRDRAAETIMLGAALYNRQIQLQQLYVKQSKNQLTLSGEGAFPTNQSGWFNPVFRGDISASIGNLGDFAGLFGANPGDFAGEIAIDGTMNARDQKIGGYLSATGKSLSIFKLPIDSFTTKLNLRATELEIKQLELRRGGDFARAAGKIDIAHEHEYSVTSSFTAANIADYVHLLPFAWGSALRQGMVSGEWSGNGQTRSHAGTFHINGRGIRTSVPTAFVPFDLELEAAYSPRNIFFRQLHLANEHASINGFLTIAEKYLQLQALALDLNGKPQLRGNIFLPIALSKMEPGRSVLDAIDPDQKIDFDLNIEPTDLAEFSQAFTGRAAISGLFGARFSFFGGPDALQGWGEIHLRDFAMENDPARISADAQTRLTAGTMNTKAGVQFRGSDPASCDLSAPIRLGKERNSLPLQPIAANIDFPKIFLARLPRYLSRDLFRDGILSGRIAFSETLQHPKVLGDMQLTKGKLGNTPLHATETSGHLTFKGVTASIDSANLGTDDVDLPFHGEIDFQDTQAVAIRLTGLDPIIDLTPRGGPDCVAGIKVMPIPAVETPLLMIQTLEFRGSVFAPNWIVTLRESVNAEPPTVSNKADTPRIFHFCGGTQTNEQMLVLSCKPRKPPPAPTARPHKRPKHR